jgi:vancomycin resistance protein VanW
MQAIWDRAASRKRAARGGIALAAPALAGAALALWLAFLPGRERPIAAFATGLRGRSASQIHNVRLALAALDGQVIPPGAEFSFNRIVGPWGPDKGYRRAPVSFSGERLLDWGGGVCQASTAVYNAALLAGLPIVERHRHHWATTYVPPGQDAAVAYPSIDLRFRNTLAAPIRIAARVEGESVLVELRSRRRPPPVRLAREVLAVTAPTVVVRPRADGRHRPVHGFPGYEVALYRTVAGRRELVSRDSYPAQNEVIAP